MDDAVGITSVLLSLELGKKWGRPKPPDPPDALWLVQRAAAVSPS